MGILAEKREGNGEMDWCVADLKENWNRERVKKCPQNLGRSMF